MSYAPYTTSPTDVMRQQSILNRVYAWMFAGLLVTGAVAMFVSTTSFGLMLASNPLIYFGLFIAQIALVIYLSVRIHKMAASTATAIFMAYSALMGVTFSTIFMVYTPVSIATTFFVTGGTFGAMSLYGYTTKQDLTKIGNLLIMGLIGFLLASVVNIFLRNEALYWIITYAGIAIFIGLIAWDTQKIKRIAAEVSGTDEATIQRVAIIGALMLYLDFINLFLLLLRIFGNRK